MRSFGEVKPTPSIPRERSLQTITQHQIQSMVNIPEYEGKPTQGRCCVCNQPKRTACIACLHVYCYECLKATPGTAVITTLQKSSIGLCEDQLQLIPHTGINDPAESTQHTTHDTDTDSDGDSEGDTENDSDI